MSNCKSNMSSNQAFLNLFEEQENCDVNFCVGSRKIGAHKAFLQGRTEVLYEKAKAWTSKDKPILIEGFSFDTFKALLRYIYSDEVNITKENVFHFLFATKTFKMGHLEVLCSKFLSSSINKETVCMHMEHAVEFNAATLEEECQNVFSKETDNVLVQPEFLGLSQDALSKFLNCSSINVLEIDLFSGVKMWMDKQCKKQGLSINGTNMRRVIGDALYKIRFPTMTMQDFSNEVTTIEGLLSDSEMLQTSRKISVYKNKGIPCPFPADFRYVNSELKTIIASGQKKLFDQRIILSHEDHWYNIHGILKNWVTKNVNFYIRDIQNILQCCTDLLNTSTSGSTVSRNLAKATKQECFDLVEEWYQILKKSDSNDDDMNAIMSKVKEIQEALANLV